MFISLCAGTMSFATYNDVPHKIYAKSVLVRSVDWKVRSWSRSPSPPSVEIMTQFRGNTRHHIRKGALGTELSE